MFKKKKDKKTEENTMEFNKAFYETSRELLNEIIVMICERELYTELGKHINQTMSLDPENIDWKDVSKITTQVATDVLSSLSPHVNRQLSLVMGPTWLGEYTAMMVNRLIVEGISKHKPTKSRESVVKVEMDEEKIHNINI